MLFSKILYRLSGADYNVIRHCSNDTRTRYINLAWSLILTSVLAFIGGFDVAHQFTSIIGVCAAVGLLWAVAVFSFDYFLINGGKVHWSSLLIRIPVGLSNIFITVTALFVLFNQSSIDTTIRLSNSSKISVCDSTYLTEKEGRYEAYNTKKLNIDDYHQQNCVPEALDGYPGPKFAVKHSLCVNTATELEQELAQLDSLEISYYQAYQNNRKALENITSNDFFAKARMLPGILKSNIYAMILAIALAVFLSYIELQSILMKFWMRDDDEYHINKARYIEGRKGLVALLMDRQLDNERKALDLTVKADEQEQNQKEHDLNMEDVNQTIEREYELTELEKLLREKGYNESADRVRDIKEEYLKRKRKGADRRADLFKMTNPMLAVVNEIKSNSAKEELSRNLFEWVLNNVEYDSNHSKEFCRNAIQTYNDRHGVCSELSVLLISFLRTAGTECSFCEVSKDDIGKEVAHACVAIHKEGGTVQLADVAYKSFDVKHIQYRIMSDNELANKFDSWNQ